MRLPFFFNYRHSRCFPEPLSSYWDTGQAAEAKKPRVKLLAWIKARGISEKKAIGDQLKKNSLSSLLKGVLLCLTLKERLQEEDSSLLPPLEVILWIFDFIFLSDAMTVGSVGARYKIEFGRFERGLKMTIW